MRKNSDVYLKSITAGIMIGGLAFAATKAMTKSKNGGMKKAAGKALKAAGTLIETFHF